jgi:hypothetical protein
VSAIEAADTDAFHDRDELRSVAPLTRSDQQARGRHPPSPAALSAWLSPQLASLTHQSVGAAYEVSGHIAAQGRPVLAEAVRHAAIGAFDHGLSIACVVAGLVAVAGALLAAVFLPAQPPQQPGPADLPSHRMPDETGAARSVRPLRDVT